MTTLTITHKDFCPDSTSFLVGAVEPDLKGTELFVYSGEGTRRSSWGAPGLTSTVVLATETLVAVHLGWHHKYNGGQAWRYYKATGGAWAQVQWAALDDDARQAVLDGYQQKAPGWAKAPGKLRTERVTAEQMKRTTYKIVRQMPDGRLVSCYDGGTEYTIGKRLAERAVGEHGGGYYSFPDKDAMLHAFAAGTLLPDRCYEPGASYAVLEVEISGTVIVYGTKLASTYLRPVRMLETVTYAPTPTPVEVY